MSNHHHVVVTDVHGVMPDFLRELHRLTAKAMNASQGQWENLWAAEPCNLVRLTTDEDVDDKIAYVVANPVAAGLVRAPEDWPGVILWGERTVRVQRPTSYFLEEGSCPRELTLHVERPAGRDVPSLVSNEWRRRVSARVKAKVAAAHRRVIESGRVFLGRAVVLASSFIVRARSYETRFGVIPTFAARDRGVREALGRVERFFRARYRGALALWRARAREGAVFPPGTWAMAIVHGATVEATG
jgi:hypothetical protein